MEVTAAVKPSSFKTEQAKIEAEENRREVAAAKSEKKRKGSKKKAEPAPEVADHGSALPSAHREIAAHEQDFERVQSPEINPDMRNVKTEALK